VSGERFSTVGDVRLCYETVGDPTRPTALLVMGLGMQLVAWPDAFCAQLAARGFHVVRSTTATRAARRTCRDAATPWRTWPGTPSASSTHWVPDPRTWSVLRSAG
jgi:pimeloyl-ACP methyl ester carboxylesterase